MDAVNKVAEEIRKEQSEKEQMNQYAREMQENKESEKFQFFNQVFAGSMPFGECLEQGKQLGIEISAEGYCVILFKIIMIDHPMDYSEDIVSATEDIENLSEQTEKLLWFRRGVEGWGFIAQGAVGEELTARAQTFREDLEKILEKYKNLEYFGGIGSQVGRFSEIKRSYNDANRAFAERFSRSLRQFVSYSEVHQVGVQNDVEMHRLGTMAENRKMLERFLKTGTENEVKSFTGVKFENANYNTLNMSYVLYTRNSMSSGLFYGHLLIDSSYNLINNTRIDNYYTRNPNEYALFIFKSNNNTIENLNLRNMANYLDNSNGNILMYNKITTDDVYAITLTNTTYNNIIKHNTLNSANLQGDAAVGADNLNNTIEYNTPRENLQTNTNRKQYNTCKSK